MMQPVLLGGLFIGILSALPIVNIANCCCIWLVTGGMLAAYLDQQSGNEPVNARRGATVGLLAGLAGTVVWLSVSLAIDPFLVPLYRRAAEMVLASGDIPESMRQSLETMRTRDANLSGYLVEFVLRLVVHSIAAAIGGVLGSVFIRRDAPPALGGPQ